MKLLPQTASTLQIPLGGILHGIFCGRLEHLYPALVLAKPVAVSFKYSDAMPCSSSFDKTPVRLVNRID